MKYKVGDKVLVKSEGWYETYKDADGNVVCGSLWLNPEMAAFCGKIVTIAYVMPNRGYVMEEIKGFLWQDWMLQ